MRIQLLAALCATFPFQTVAADFWLSGGSSDRNVPSQVQAWGDFRGRPSRVVTVFPTRGFGWEAFVSSHADSGMPGMYQDKALTLIMQTSPFPTNIGGSYKSLIDGEYDAQWQKIGTLLRQREEKGFAPIILSPAWEMNGIFMPWGGGGGAGKYSSPAQYVQGFRRIVQQLRSTYPNAKIAWTINGHSTAAATGTTNAFDFYPGDEYVNFLGIDDYDHYPPVFTKEAFDIRAKANAGLLWLADHARARGKQVILPEWGIDVGAGKDGGGDNANYIQWMFETFKALHSEKLLAGEYYYGDTVGGGNVDSDLIAANPKSRERYVSLWKESAVSLTENRAKQAGKNARSGPGRFQKGASGSAWVLIPWLGPGESEYRWYDLRGSALPSE